MKDDNCIFCKLANGDIPTNTIYEDADFRVILDASPATKGHALILPKQHYANMFEMDDEVLAKAAKLAKKALTRKAGEHSPYEHIARIENEILDAVNHTGIGPGGLGGKTTALAVNIETYATHIAGMPLAVNMCCHVNRHVTRIL